MIPSLVIWGPYYFLRRLTPNPSPFLPFSLSTKFFFWLIKKKKETEKKKQIGFCFFWNHACFRKLLGQDLGSCTVDELSEIDNQLRRSLMKITARKEILFMEQIKQLKAKEKTQLEEKAGLLDKCALEPQHPQAEHGECIAYTLSHQSSEVETELIIGLPEMHCCQ